MNTKAIASFFYYMWNRWGMDECEHVFAEEGWQHIWNKWMQAIYRNNGRTMGASECFFAELDAKNQHLLASRALELYNGRERR